MSVQGAPQVTWTWMNHKYVAGTHKDGYAVCVNCGAHENQTAITKPCPEGPVEKLHMGSVKTGP